MTAPTPAELIGDDLTFIALPGEPTAGYALRLRKELSDQRVWVAGFCNDLCGYICTDSQLIEGGLEAGDSQLYWGWPSPWAKGLEDRVVTAARKLAAAK